jgi:membrane complex biogenesis BtpA family protein
VVERTRTQVDKAIIGVIHLPPLPGTPFHRPEDGDTAEVVARTVASARALEAGGATGCLVQTADRVYPVADEADPARVAAVAVAVDAVRRATGPRFAVGVQILWNAVRASLAVASVAGGSFVRANALVGATLSPHGMVVAEPEAVMRYRAALGAGGVEIVADVYTMHFRWLGGGRSVGDVARAARQVGADAVSLCHPDDERTLALVAEVRRAEPGLRVILGGHTNHANAARLLDAADGAFVGTCLQRGGWGGPVDADLVRKYVAEVTGEPGG